MNNNTLGPMLPSDKGSLLAPGGTSFKINAPEISNSLKLLIAKQSNLELGISELVSVLLTPKTLCQWSKLRNAPVSESTATYFLNVKCGIGELVKKEKDGQVYYVRTGAA